MHTISWSKICQPRVRAGLGLKTMRDLNISSRAHSAWRLLNQLDTLWVRILRGNMDMSGNWQKVSHSFTLLANPAGRL